MIITESLNSYRFYTVAMSARLVQHLSCLLILIQKVKELLPVLESGCKGIDYYEKSEKTVQRMVNRDLFGF